MKQKKLNVKIMGILNATPDSFFDAGRFFDEEKAVKRASQMIREGADIIDIGGESSGPGSSEVSLKEELRRTIPVIKKIKAQAARPVIISIDTYKAEVARQAIAAGADMVNDVTALRGDSNMAKVIAETGVQVILMYSKDKTARTTRIKKRYKDVVRTIKSFLHGRVKYALKAGISREKIIIDPGMGAFISGEPKYSLEVIRRLGELKDLGFPILVGISMKSCLPGALNERQIPTFIANLAAVHNGADFIRVHDVALSRQFKLDIIS